MNISTSMRAAISIAELVVEEIYPHRGGWAYHFDLKASDPFWVESTQYRDIEVTVSYRDEVLLVISIQLSNDFDWWDRARVEVFCMGNVYCSFFYMARRVIKWNLRTVARLAYTEHGAGDMLPDPGYHMDGLPSKMRSAALS